MCNSSLVASFNRSGPEFTETLGPLSAGSLIFIKSLLNSHKYVLIYLCGDKNKHVPRGPTFSQQQLCVLISVNIFSRKPHKGCMLKCVDSLWFMPAWWSLATIIIPFDAILGNAPCRSPWEQETGCWMKTRNRNRKIVVYTCTAERSLSLYKQYSNISSWLNQSWCFILHVIKDLKSFCGKYPISSPQTDRQSRENMYKYYRFTFVPHIQRHTSTY